MAIYSRAAAFRSASISHYRHLYCVCCSAVAPMAWNQSGDTRWEMGEGSCARGLRTLCGHRETASVLVSSD